MRLLAWWRSRRHKRRTDIFWFWDGTRLRGADPIRVMQEFALHPEFNPETTPTEVSHPDRKIAAIASKICLSAVYQAFGVHEWRQDERGNASGLTAEEAMSLIPQFDIWMNALKKNGSGLLTTSPITTDSSCNTNCGAEDTKPPSDSGSIETGSNSDAPRS